MGLCSSTKERAGMSLSSKSIGEKRESGEFVIFIGHAANLPNMDVGSLSDPYATVTIKDRNDVVISSIFKTQIRRDSLCPTWNTFAAFPIQPYDDDVIHVKILDSDDVGADDAIGFAEIVVADIRSHSVQQPGAFVLTMETTLKLPDPTQPAIVTLGSLQNEESCQPHRIQDQGFAIEKEFWLIRHGESKWNEATEEWAVTAMVGYDHPLNTVGIDQALTFNAKWTKAQAAGSTHQLTIAESKFLKAERVIASPLTRATQTALLTCHSHIHLNNTNKPLMLFRNLREKKNKSLSLDTVGQEVGAGIRRRVQEQLIEEKFSNNPTEVEKYMNVKMNYNDCDTVWWTGKSHGDSKVALTSRYDELWSYLKYMKETSAILVGHSLFFREMQRRYLDAEYCQTSTGTAFLRFLNFFFPFFFFSFLFTMSFVFGHQYRYRYHIIKDISS